MTKVIVDLSMSLDGFITGPHPSKQYGLGMGKGGQLHEWYFNGGMPSAYSSTFTAEGANREVVDEMFTTTGAMVIGRELYDIVDGWGGNHPIEGLPIVVLSHSVPEHIPQGKSPIVFTNAGIEGAIERGREMAGEKDVTVAGANMAQQALNAGLVDELMIHLAPVLLGDGVRLFDHLQQPTPDLTLVRTTEGPGMTHMRYAVEKASDSV